MSSLCDFDKKESTFFDKLFIRKSMGDLRSSATLTLCHICIVYLILQAYRFTEYNSFKMGGGIVNLFACGMIL